MSNTNPYDLQFISGNTYYLPGTEIPVHFNHYPKKVYEITWEVKNAPIPLVQVINPANEGMEKEGMLSTNYVAFNSDKGHSCQYSAQSLLYSHTPRATVLMPIHQISVNKFKIYYVVDAILNEDYGLDILKMDFLERNERMGTCLWEGASGVSISYSPTGKYEEPVIIVNLGDESKFMGNKYPITYYYEKRYITQIPQEKQEKNKPYYVSLGKLGMTREELKNLRDDELFSITVSIRSVY